MLLYTFTGCVLLLSLGSVEIEGISLGRILAVLAVLLCARYGGVAGGSVSGAAAGAVFSLAREGQGYLCGGFAFGGLVAGVFAPLGKFACALSFLLSHALMSLAFGQERVLPSVLIESFIGSVTFLLLPKEVGNVVARRRRIAGREFAAQCGDAAGLHGKGDCQCQKRRQKCLRKAGRAVFAHL